MGSLKAPRLFLAHTKVCFFSLTFGHMIYTCVKLCVGPKKLVNEVELLKIIFKYLLA